MSDTSLPADAGDAGCQFGAVFLRNTIKFVSPVDYIEYCLKAAYVAQDGLNRLQELILCRPTDDRKSKSPSPACEETKNPAVLERVGHVFPDMRMRCPDFASGPSDINKDQTPPPNLLDSLDTQNMSHYLFSACYHGQSKTLKHLLSEQRMVSLINECDENGCTALLWAIASQSTTCVSTLISHHADVNMTDKQGRSSLHWACRLGHMDGVKLLLQQEVDINQPDAMGRTPLHMAAECHHCDAITVLLKEGGTNLDVHKKDNDGVTALMLAARLGGSEKVQLLLKEGADPTSMDRHGRSVIHWAAGNPNLKSVRCVVDHHKPSLHFTDSFQQTALHTAAAEGNLKVLEFLVKKGVSPSVDAIGASPLHWAAFSGHLNCVKYLLGMKFGDSLISRADNSGALPTHYAALRGQDNIITILTDKKNQCGCVDSFGLSPLCWAVFGDHGRTVNLMVKSKADVVQQDSNGRTVLHLAAHLGLSDLCQLLISKGAELHAADNSQAIPLLLSARYGHARTIYDLIQSGSSVIAKDDKQRTAVHLATRAGHADVLRVLLDAGAERDATDSNGTLAIQYAADSGRTEAIRVLIDHGSSVEVTGPDGRTLLHQAAAAGFVECCSLLIRCGVPVNTMDNSIHKMTALDLAVDGQHKACVDFLTSEQARTNGGQFHRSARLLQAWWRFRRYKQRQGVSREHAALVLQCASRQLLAGKRVRRLKNLRLSVRNRAALAIQNRWRFYIQEKRRYEASYATLKANLEEEKKQALMALKMIREQEHNCKVPPIQPRHPQCVAFRQLGGRLVPGSSLNPISHPMPVRSSISAPVYHSPAESHSSKAKRQGQVSSPLPRDIQCKQTPAIVKVTLPDIKVKDSSSFGTVEQSEKKSLDKKPAVAVRFSQFNDKTTEKADEVKESSQQDEGKKKSRRPQGELVVLSNRAAILERQNKTLLDRIEARDREIQHLREENRQLTILKRMQARELADVRQKVETTELNSASPSRFTGYGRPTQLHANETSVSNSSSLHRMKSVDGRQIGKNSRNEVLLQHRSHIEQYKLRCEELRRVVESVKEMQKLLRSQSHSSLGASAMQTSRDDLKQQIRNALEEVIRLRSETDALESLVKRQQSGPPKKEQGLPSLTAVPS